MELHDHVKSSGSQSEERGLIGVEFYKIDHLDHRN